MFTLPFLYLFFSIYVASVYPLLILYQTLSNRAKTQYEKPNNGFSALFSSWRGPSESLLFRSLVLLSSCHLETSIHHHPGNPLPPLHWIFCFWTTDFPLSWSTSFSSLAHPLVRFPKKTAWDRNFLRCFIAENILNLPSFLEVHTIIFFQNYEETVPVLAVERSANIWPWLGTIPTRTWPLYIIFSFFLEIFKGFTICLTLQDFMLCLKVGPFPSTVLGTQWSLNLEIQVFQFWEVFLSLFLSYFLSLLFWCSFSLGSVLFGCWASWTDLLIFCPLGFFCSTVREVF